MLNERDIKRAIGVDLYGPDGSRISFDKANAKSDWGMQMDMDYLDYSDAGVMAVAYRGVSVKVYLSEGASASMYYPGACTITYCKRHKRLTVKRVT